MTDCGGVRILGVLTAAAPDTRLFAAAVQCRQLGIEQLNEEVGECTVRVTVAAQGDGRVAPL